MRCGNDKESVVGFLTFSLGLGEAGRQSYWLRRGSQDGEKIIGSGKFPEVTGMDPE